MGLYDRLVTIDDVAMKESSPLITRTLLFSILITLAACSDRPKVDPEVLKQQRDKFTSALSAQQQAINYPSIVMHEGERIDIRVGHAVARDLRRAICSQGGWLSSD